jgi:hypothetical protein
MINFISLKIGGKWLVLVRKTVIFNEKHQNFYYSKMVKKQRRTSFYVMYAF